MLTYGFLKLNLDSIETKIFSNNSSSLKLAEKLGFEYLELKKNYLVKDGKFIDVYFLRLQIEYFKIETNNLGIYE